MRRVTAQLEPGEEVRLDARPHGIALVQPLLRPLALVGPGVVLVVVGQEFWIAGIAGAALLALAALLAFRAVLRWDRTRLLLTSREAHRSSTGVARRRSASVPLAHVPALEFEQGILGRLFGYGTLVAGDFEVPYVPDARRVRKLVA